MKLLVFTDPHGNVNILKKHAKTVKEQGVDLVLLTGDLTFFGDDLKVLLKQLDTFAAPVYIIHGNHEEEEEMALLCESLSNITFLHKKIVQFKGWWFGAYSTCGLRESYPDQEEWVREHKADLESKKPLIWLDHPPPRDTATDNLGEDWHVGSESYRKLIDQFQPRYAFCGHIHETFGMEDIVGETIIINSGPTGKLLELD